MSLSAIPKSFRIAVFQRDTRRCRYCHILQFGQGAVFRINHVIPRCHGGAMSMDNLVLHCPWCSLHKSDKLTGIDPHTQNAAAIFHPLCEEWSEHFATFADGTVEGKTEVGWATIAAHRMNHSIPKTARMLQRALGMYVE